LESVEGQLMGCAPYLQLFKSGKLIYTSAATLHVQQSKEELPFVQVIDGTVPFNINEVIQGDILIRCRHLTFHKKRISMFRAAFHTGYVPPNVLRLTKSQLDGACNDDRYPDDFFLDLIFEKVDEDTMATHLEEDEDEDADQNEASKSGNGGPVVKPSKFDSMLNGDSRFWDVINSKKQEHMKQKNDDPFWGPTVGRRRGGDAKESKEETEEPSKQGSLEERSQLETFSIGNEFDFVPGESEEEKPQRDSLMDALNALDEDEGAHREADMEEINFEPPTDGQSTSPIFSDGVAFLSETSAPKPEQKSSDINAEQPSKEVQTLREAKESPSDDLDDMDDLLAVADEDFGDLNLGDFDDDNDDIEDLESLLKM
jgi:tensin